MEGAHGSGITVTLISVPGFVPQRFIVIAQSYSEPGDLSHVGTAYSRTGQLKY